jgi:hypothetical protein
MRKLIAVLFLIVLSIQILPVEVIGKMLWNNQLTEEVHEHGPSSKKLGSIHHDKCWYLYFAHTIDVADKNTSNLFHALQDEPLIKCHHLDVPLQPPNA